MNTEDILRMAQEASLICVSEPVTPWIEDTDLTPHLLRFAKLLSDAKDAKHKESMKWDIHTCGPTCKRYACVSMREAVQAERERFCAVLRQLHDSYSLASDPNKLRARGNP